MPTVENMAQDNRVLRNRLKAGLDDRKYPVDGPLWPLLYLAVKLLRHGEALELLAGRGFGSEAGIMLRTMFEAAVNVMWITKGSNPDELIAKLKRYSDYQIFVSQKYRDYTNKSGVLNNLPQETQEAWQKYDDILKDKAFQLKDEYGFTYRSWSGKTLKEMAYEIGWGERYDTEYQIYSDMIHSGIMSVQEYLVFDNTGKVTVNYRSQTEHCKACLYESELYVLTAFSFLNIFLDLKLDKVIRDGLAGKKRGLHIPDQYRIQE